MTRLAACLLLLLFTLGWFGWTAIDLLDAIIGDCFDDVRCNVTKQYAPALVLWRGLAIEMAAFALYKFARKMQDS